MNLSPNQSPAGSSKAKDWQKTQYANLIRYVPSGVYFARLRVCGKPIVRSLKTRSLTVAKLKLADLEKQLRSQAESGVKLTEGAVPFDALLTEYRERLKRNHTIKQRSRDYREECIKRILKSWPEISGTEVRKITQDDCERWAGRFVSGTSPTAFNNTVGTLRQILQIAVEKGIRYTNPASSIKRTRIRQKQLVLPSQEQFTALVEEIRRVPFGPGPASAELVEFLAFGGFRKGGAKHITWADCGFVREEIVVRGDPVTGTKNSLVRRVPMIPEMRQLLETLRSERVVAGPATNVMRVAECQGALTRACKAFGIHRITHHDLRHLFATRCIESGVDIPTVSRWLGQMAGDVRRSWPADQVREALAIAESHGIRVVANAITLHSWRNGPIEDVHAGRGEGYELGTKQVRPQAEKAIIRQAQEGMCTGLKAVDMLKYGEAWPPSAVQVLPFLHSLVGPWGWSYTDDSRAGELRLRGLSL